MDRTKAYKHFHALLEELGIRERKADILSGYGVESTTQLTDDQLVQLIGRLEEQKRSIEENAVRLHRSRVLRLLTDMGVYYVIPGEPKEACWRRVNDFLSSPRIAGKVLYRMSSIELTALEGKLRSLRSKGYVYPRTAEPTESPESPIVVVLNPGSSGPVN